MAFWCNLLYGLLIVVFIFFCRDELPVLGLMVQRHAGRDLHEPARHQAASVGRRGEAQIPLRGELLVPNFDFPGFAIFKPTNISNEMRALACALPRQARRRRIPCFQGSGTKRAERNRKERFRTPEIRRRREREVGVEEDSGSRLVPKCGHCLAVNSPLERTKRPQTMNCDCWLGTQVGWGCHQLDIFKIVLM